MELPARFDDPYRARHRTAAQIRSAGAIGSLNDGVEVEIHGVATRLIAWPGTGFQTQSVHVLTLEPGQEMDMHAYGLAEESILALQGEGEVFVRNHWARFRPGDVGFFPPPVEHAIRATPGGPGLVAVASISPPEFELYEPAGFYNRQYGVVNQEAAWFARSNATPGKLSGPSQLAYHDSDPAVRAWNLTVSEIRTHGALFNVFCGAKIDVIEAPMVFVLWPGYGARSTGFHFANGDDGLTTAVHTHPASDECVVLWDGTARAWQQGGWHDMEVFDVVFAPCGVEHGISSVTGEALWGGFAAPPQLDLYARTPYYNPPGTFAEVPFGRLDR
ncbi:cupin domain-containing protein [Rhodococcus jostii]|uniref:Gentisate 1,2-dioxygenase n=1 Tax=Rhodococcus jostii TaxID=132919 RepID=A0A1H4W2E5_RHOJO|nr:cupin domain-containing protein [Rhodococcus jostii]SEC87549.1 gentisate 1,2-dioxygenase [Rhodococcus jostii]